jgi:hypothetical protein
LVGKLNNLRSNNADLMTMADGGKLEQFWLSNWDEWLISRIYSFELIAFQDK